LLTVLALIQDVVLTRISIGGGQFDVVLVAVIAWGLLRGPAEGMIWAFIGGLVLDLFSGGPMGGITLALLIVAFLAGQQWGSELGLAYIQLILLTLVLSFLYHMLLLVVLGWRGYPVNWVYSLPRVAAPSAALNAVLAPLVYRPLIWLDRRTRPEGLTFDA
jgi:rod shape-determining protein MreD